MVNLAETMASQNETLLLRELFKATQVEPNGVSRRAFLAKHPGHIDEVDRLIAGGEIQVLEGKNLRLPLLGLTQLAAVMPEAESVRYLCSHLFNVLHAEFINNPDSRLSVSEIASLADMPDTKVARALGYLLDAPIFESWGKDKEGQYKDIALSDEILRYETFNDVIHAMHVKRQSIASQAVEYTTEAAQAVYAASERQEVEGMMTTRTIDAFLSYHSRERSQAAQVNEWLLSHGVRTHFWDEDMAPGTPISEERFLREAATVVVLLGDAGWGPTHIHQASLVRGLQKPVFPVLVGKPPEGALDAAGGLFRSHAYVDVSSGSLEPLEAVIRAIRRQIGAPDTDEQLPLRRPKPPTDVSLETGLTQPAAKEGEPPVTDPWIERIAEQIVGGNDDQRANTLAEIQRDESFHRPLGERLRAEIHSRYSPPMRASRESDNPPPLIAENGSARSWLISALLLCDPEHPDTRSLVLHYVGSLEPDWHVRFWALAGLLDLNASYLSEAAVIATRDATSEVADLGRVAADKTNAHVWLKESVSSKSLQVTRSALRVLRVVSYPELVDVIAAQLERAIEVPSLIYDALYAASHPVVVDAVATRLQQGAGPDAAIDLVLRVGGDARRSTLRAFARLLARLDGARVSAALSREAANPARRGVVQLLRSYLQTLLVPSLGQRARLAGFNSDSADGQEDRLNIEQEVATFAAIMMSTQVTPPLAIGLFGDWGSGKSFFMNKLKEQVNTVATYARDTSSKAYHSNVVQVHFNAWYYVDTQLWPSLVTYILEQLAAYVSPKATVKEQHAKLMEDLGSAKARSQEIEAEKARVTNQVSEDEKKLAKLRTDRLQKEVKLADLRALDVVRLLGENPDVKQEVKAMLASAGAPAALASVEDLRDAADNAQRVAKSAVERVVVASGETSRTARIILMLLILLGPLAVLYLFNLYAAEIGTLAKAVSALMTQVGLMVVTIATALRKGTQIAQANLGKVLAAKVRVEELIAEKRAKVSSEEQELASKVEQLKVDEQQVVARLAVASAHVAEIEERLRHFNEAASLSRFLSDRTRSDDYRKHLGLISLVRRDFEDLSEKLRHQHLLGQERRRVDRIVLYIDDLDRCPAARVVEVLQAVHLLLAYELFVVVVGVDSRWLLNSLENHYAELRGKAVDASDPGMMFATPQHYLEKIFQIPYCLRPMDEVGYQNLIGYAMSAQESRHSDENAQPGFLDAPRNGGAKYIVVGAGPPAPAVQERTVRGRSEEQASSTRVAVPDTASIESTNSEPTTTIPTANSDGAILIHEQALVIQDWEICFAQTLHRLIPSPRAAKRLSNTYRILKARVPGDRLEAFEGSSEAPGGFQVPMLLLAMLIGDTAAMSQLMPQLLQGAQRMQTITSVLATASFGQERSAAASNESARARLGTLAHKLTLQKGFPQDVALLVEWIPHVARFSFDVQLPSNTCELPSRA